jgi:hypothetical protein
MDRYDDYQTHEPRKSWWSRNWKWFVPTGCLSMIILAGVAIFFFVTTVMKNSTPFVEAIETALTNEYVIDILGEPITQEGMVQGEIFFENDKGEADLYIPIQGSKRSGIIHVVGNKIDGKWIFSEMEVSIESTQDTINLLETE